MGATRAQQRHVIRGALEARRWIQAGACAAIGANRSIHRSPPCASHLFLFSPAGGLGKALWSGLGGAICPRMRPQPKYAPKTLGQIVARMAPSCAIRGWLCTTRGLLPKRPGPLGLMDKASDLKIAGSSPAGGAIFWHTRLDNHSKVSLVLACLGTGPPSRLLGLFCSGCCCCCCRRCCGCNFCCCKLSYG